ncbi:MAG: hypothetical protein GEV00_03950 [Actinophytocola sp.]|nr:hypothetical protein [Actinophytocola sp.]
MPTHRRQPTTRWRRLILILRVLFGRPTHTARRPWLAAYLGAAVVIVLPMLAISGTGGSPAAPLAARSAADAASIGDPARAATPTVTRRESLPSGPYLYLQSDHLPDVCDVMRRTGVTGFTLAFMLSDGGCRAVWSGGEPVAERAARLIPEIRSAGGDVAVSFGGWAGLKLGQRCPDARALAAAYQRVIDRYRLRAIDVDIEWHEFESAAAQDRVLTALKIVESANPGIATSVTVPVTGDGLNSWGDRLVGRAAELRVPVDVWTIMRAASARPPPSRHTGRQALPEAGHQLDERRHRRRGDRHPERLPRHPPLRGPARPGAVHVLGGQPGPALPASR